MIGCIVDARDSFIGCNEIKSTTKHSIVNGNNSAVSNKVTWWYGACHDSNLNGLYTSVVLILPMFTCKLLY